MKVESFIDAIGADFFVGVPDSQLKALCNYLITTYGVDGEHHIIAANEGNCAAIAAGYHMATGKTPIVYMQNSGEGNIVNPVASLMNEKVYGIPCIFVVGWRGEPGVHDEPQHVFQGEITNKLLEDMGINSFVVSKDTTPKELSKVMENYSALLSAGKQVAFVVRKGALEFENAPKFMNKNAIIREDAIRHIIRITGDDPIISTTGKTSRELFELRVENNQTHEHDFLTVGSMGHSSSIALGIALHKPNKKVWIIDGDGSLLMHMGSMALIGAYSPINLVHIVINNSSHESVGGQPTVAEKLDLIEIAKGCGYPNLAVVDTIEELDATLRIAKENNGLSFIEVKCAIGARANLGRPTTTAKENKECFMNFLSRT